LDYVSVRALSLTSGTVTVTTRSKKPHQPPNPEIHKCDSDSEILEVTSAIGCDDRLYTLTDRLRWPLKQKRGRREAR